jgi:hypothetical protein
MLNTVSSNFERKGGGVEEKKYKENEIEMHV